MTNEEVFKRHEGNPILTAKNLKGANSIFNSAIVRFGGGFAGIFRVDALDLAQEIHAGFSDDGLNWKIDEKRISFANPQGFPVGFGYDPRVTEIDGEHYITWCYYPESSGPCMGLGKTRDFKNFELVAPIMLPFNRNAVLFPRKINGRFAMLHRPSDTGHTPFGDIFYATSDDLVSWGEHRFVLGPKGGWQAGKVGAGPVPIETDEGWLVIYHGVRFTCNGFIYCGGGAILDRDEPWKVKYRSKKYLLAPSEIYERTGDVPNVVFPNSAIIKADGDSMDLYYGAADSVVCMAQGKISEIVNFIKENSF